VAGQKGQFLLDHNHPGYWVSWMSRVRSYARTGAPVQRGCIIDLVAVAPTKSPWEKGEVRGGGEGTRNGGKGGKKKTCLTRLLMIASKLGG